MTSSVEVYEQQHDQPVAHFDKPDKLTISGVHRCEQRASTTSAVVSSLRPTI
jgi:hypothetical protein